MSLRTLRIFGMGRKGVSGGGAEESFSAGYDPYTCDNYHTGVEHVGYV